MHAPMLLLFMAATSSHKRYHSQLDKFYVMLLSWFCETMDNEADPKCTLLVNHRNLAQTRNPTQTLALEAEIKKHLPANDAETIDMFLPVLEGLCGAGPNELQSLPAVARTITESTCHNVRQGKLKSLPGVLKGSATIALPATIVTRGAAASEVPSLGNVGAKLAALTGSAGERAAGAQNRVPHSQDQSTAAEHQQQAVTQQATFAGHELSLSQIGSQSCAEAAMQPASAEACNAYRGVLVAFTLVLKDLENSESSSGVLSKQEIRQAKEQVLALRSQLRWASHETTPTLALFGTALMVAPFFVLLWARNRVARSCKRLTLIILCVRLPLSITRTVRATLQARNRRSRKRNAGVITAFVPATEGDAAMQYTR
mmetsp:Transcript_53377/g.88631  ORF Transcript_53377/g.88631 Transcript_53377/m.88631 type:complete len:372 (-) Transcript_53377:119-1234(-)